MVASNIRKKIKLSDGEIALMNFDEFFEQFKKLKSHFIYGKFKNLISLRLNSNYSVTTYEDIDAVANLALFNTFNNYDIEKGANATTLCSHYIISDITKHISRIEKIDNYKPDKKNFFMNITSIDNIVGFNDNGTKLSVGDFLLDNKNHFDNIHNNILLEKGFKELSKDDEELLKLYFYQNMTQVELAKMFNTTQVVISRRIKKILKKMKVSINSPNIKIIKKQGVNKKMIYTKNVEQDSNKIFNYLEKKAATEENRTMTSLIKETAVNFGMDSSQILRIINTAENKDRLAELKKIIKNNNTNKKLSSVVEIEENKCETKLDVEVISKVIRIGNLDFKIDKKEIVTQLPKTLLNKTDIENYIKIFTIALEHFENEL